MGGGGGVNSAVLQFNDVLSAMLNVFEYFGFQGGDVTNNISLRGGSVKESQRKSSDTVNKRRKRSRSKD